MGEPGFGQKLKAWRRASGIKQAAIATTLGVSQAAVSRWESGLDLPPGSVVSRLQALIAQGVRDELMIERRFIERRASVEAIFDFDGIRLLAASGGMTQLWPQFSRLVGRAFEARMIGESRLAVDDQSLRKSVIRGEVAVIVGVSTRHLDLDVDSTIKHRWISRFRTDGQRILTSMVYEPCDQEISCGIQEVVRLDDFSRI